MVITSAPAYVATAEVIKVVSPLNLTPLRFLLSALVLGSYFLITKRRIVLRPPNAPRVFGIVILGYGVYVTLLNLGQSTVSAGTTSMLVNTAPVFAFILARVFLKERTSRVGLIGLATAVLGTVIVTLSGSTALGFDRNALLIVAAALALGIFLILQQPVFAAIPPVELVFWGCLVGGLATLPFADFNIHLETWAPSTHVALAVLVIFSTVLACTYWNISLAATSVATGGSLLFAIPVFSVVLGWLLLGQVPSTGAILGGAIALGGVAILGRQGTVNRANAPHEPDVKCT